LGIRDQESGVSDAARTPVPRPEQLPGPVDLWRSRGAQLASVLACLALAAGAGLYRIRTFDTLFHLAAGRWILREGRVPATDPFSFSFRGAPWVNHSWGFQVWIAALHRAGGFALLSLHQAIAAAMLAGLGLLAMRRQRELLPLAAPLMAAPVLAFREVLEARPHVLGFIGLSLTLLVTLQASAEQRPRLLAWLAPIYAGWAISHGSHLLAFVVVGAALPGLLLQPERARVVPWLLCLAALLGLCSWLAPSGLLQGREHFASGFLEGSVSEWYPVELGELLQHGSGLTFLACLALAWCGAALVHLRVGERGARFTRALYPLLLLATFTVLAFSSRRMIALLLFGAAPLWLPYASQALARALHALPGVPRLLPLALVACWSALFATLALAGAPFRSGLGLQEDRFPAAAVAAIQRQGHITRVYNAYNFGGYLMFEGVPPAGVFVDGRALTLYPPEFLASFERAYRDPELFETLVARFAIDGVLLPVDSERAAPLRAYLDRSPRWHGTFRDSIAVVYEHARSTH
jgi:hypothetical protein